MRESLYALRQRRVEAETAEEKPIGRHAFAGETERFSPKPQN